MHKHNLETCFGGEKGHASIRREKGVFLREKGVFQLGGRTLNQLYLEVEVEKSELLHSKS